MRSSVRSLSQWLAVAAYISIPLAQAQTVKIPLQTFEDEISYLTDSAINPLRTAISQLEKLTTETYPIGVASSSAPAFQFGSRRSVATKVSGLQRGISQVSDELDNSVTSESDADFDALRNVLENIRAKFAAYSGTKIRVPDGFYSLPAEYDYTEYDIWAFINGLTNHLVLTGGIDHTDASAERLISFMFSAPPPEDGTITLNFDAFESRLRTLTRLVATLGVIIDAPNDDIANFISMVNAYDLPNALELELFLTSGYEDVQTMLRAYLDVLSTITWKLDDIYWSARGQWVDED